MVFHFYCKFDVSVNFHGFQERKITAMFVNFWIFFKLVLNSVVILSLIVILLFAMLNSNLFRRENQSKGWNYLDFL